jgi:hypothetical protein
MLGHFAEIAAIAAVAYMAIDRARKCGDNL